MIKSRLFWKLFLAFWLATVVSFALAVTLFFITGKRTEFDRGFRAGELMEVAASLVQVEGVQPVIRILRERPAEWVGSIGLYDEQGQLLGGNPVPSPAVTERWVQSADGQRYRLASAGLTFSQTNPSPDYWVPLMIGTVVSIIFSAILAWYLSRPLLLLSQAFQQAGQGNLATRVRPLMGLRSDEIVDLGLDFDRMATQLQQLMQSQQRLLHDVSHELRSPLTRLQVAIGLMRQSSDQDGDMLQRIERESERLDHLIEQLLTLSRLEAGAGGALTDKVDLIELLALIVEDANFEASARDCAVKLQAQGEFIAQVNGELLYRALENVIRNAVKYTRPGSTVTVSAAVQTQTGQLHIRVQDQGPGIPNDMLEKIFEPFTRVDNSATGKGFGLGLAISKKALEMHNGWIRPSNAQDGGLVMEIVI
jgi:signal transduction histidine kinase